MTHLAPASFKPNQLGEDLYATQPILERTRPAGAIPDGGHPPARDFTKRVYHHLPEDQKPSAAKAHLSGCGVSVTDPEPQELGMSGGRQVLKVTGRELFQGHPSGKPMTLLAKDRQLAGFMSLHDQSSRLYEVGEGYTRPGVYTPTDYTTSYKTFTDKGRESPADSIHPTDNFPEGPYASTEEDDL